MIAFSMVHGANLFASSLLHQERLLSIIQAFFPLPGRFFTLIYILTCYLPCKEGPEGPHVTYTCNLHAEDFFPEPYSESKLSTAVRLVRAVRLAANHSYDGMLSVGNVCTIAHLGSVHGLILALIGIRAKFLLR